MMRSGRWLDTTKAFALGAIIVGTSILAGTMNPWSFILGVVCALTIVYLVEWWPFV